MSANFVHLRLHTEYSISDGTIRIAQLIDTAKKDQMIAVAVTDLSNLFAAVKFYRQARKAGIKPIIGADVWITSEFGLTRLLLLCRNQAGYLRLCELITQGYRSGQPQGEPAIDQNLFDEGDNTGLIALCGGREGEIAQYLLKGKVDQAKKAAHKWQERFGNRFFLELQKPGHLDDEALIDAMLDVAHFENLPAVATHPVQFLMPEDALAHDARVCIAEKETLKDPNRPRRFLPDQYFLLQTEMWARFSELPQALLNSVEIARACNFEFELGTAKLPLFPTPEGMSLDDFFISEAKTGLGERLVQLFSDPQIRENKRALYEARLQFEINTIIQMGFAGYFLIVADFILWAKENHIPVGPGRGSGAGSLVAYSLRITDLDPIKYDLLFERFLNPERVSMPDFDIDFCQDGRDRVIDYVRQKYGDDAVSQIATFGAMTAKAVVRDIGRVLGLPYSRSDEISKMIPFTPGKHITLEMAYKEVPELKARKENDEDIAEMLHLAEQCEGLVRNIGMHAGGVLIAPGKLTDFCPLYCAPGSTDIVSQFDKNDVEDVGLVKFDFLGLRTLTVIALSLDFVREKYPEYQHFRIDDLDLNDQKVFQLFCDANTTGVFQSESRMAKELEKRIKPDRFEDIIDLMALNRPGPLQSGMVDDYINRKHGLAKPEYFHPSLEPVLKPTHGVIVYQEQVMRIAQELAGFSLGKADFLRRAMGKKNADEMAKMGEAFREGAIAQHVDLKLADELFNLMAKFAEYGFNKSHSAAYAIIAYQTAWLKTYFTAEFIAATLSLEASPDKFSFICQDAKQNEIDVLAPDINLSHDKFYPVDKHTIRFGLAAIKGVGEAVAKQIVDNRKRVGPFIDYFDFCARLSKKYINRRVLEALICSGAFDSVHDNRRSLLESIDLALSFAEQNQADSVQVSLFGDIESIDQARPALADVLSWTLPEQLQQEKRVLGLYLKGHPFEAYQAEVRQVVTQAIDSVSNQREVVTIAGIISAIRIQKTRRGKIAILTLDDMTATIEVVVYPELMQMHPLAEDSLLIVKGRVSYDDYAGGYRMNAESIGSLSTARESAAACLTICVDHQVDVDRLMSILQAYRQPKGASLVFHYQNKTATCKIKTGRTWSLLLKDELVHNLKTWLGNDAIIVDYE